MLLFSVSPTYTFLWVKKLEYEISWPENHPETMVLYGSVQTFLAIYSNWDVHCSPCAFLNFRKNYVRLVSQSVTLSTPVCQDSPKGRKINLRGKVLINTNNKKNSSTELNPVFFYFVDFFVICDFFRDLYKLLQKPEKGYWLVTRVLKCS